MFFMRCPMDIIKVDINKSRFISDGGCGYLEPDNSFNAFLSSCNRMYYGVKADIRFTKDRVIKLGVCRAETFFFRMIFFAQKAIWRCI